MNRKEKNFIAIFTDSEKGMLHIENTYTNKKDFENDLKQVGYKKIRIFAESEIKEIIKKYWSIEMPEKYTKTKYDCEVVYYIYETFRNTTEEQTEGQEQAEKQEAVPAEETAKNTEISAEEETEEITEEPGTEEQEATPAEETAKNTENSTFRYKINILEVLKKSGYTSTRIRKEKLFAQVTLQKFRAGDTNISLQTVADICNLTGLQPWDILGFETEEQAAEPAEETAKNTEISAEEKTVKCCT